MGMNAPKNLVIVFVNNYLYALVCCYAVILDLSP